MADVETGKRSADEENKSLIDPKNPNSSQSPDGKHDGKRTQRPKTFSEHVKDFFSVLLRFLMSNNVVQDDIRCYSDDPACHRSLFHVLLVSHQRKMLHVY